MDYKVKGLSGSSSTNAPEVPVENEEDFNHIDEDLAYLINMHEIIMDVDPLNAPPVSVLESWKSKYKHIYISRVVSPDEYYIWRTIRRGEFKKLNSDNCFENPTAGYEILVETCLLYPTPNVQWRLTSPAGVIESLGKQISYQSGFVSDAELINLIRVV